MFGTVVVPVDGSERAQSAVGHATDLARLAGVPLVVVDIASRRNPVGVVRDALRDASAPLLCLAAPARGRAGREARSVLRRLPAPAVLVGPGCSTGTSPTKGDALVCLDGSRRAEAVLPLVEGWTGTTGHRVRLVTVAGGGPLPEDPGAEGRAPRHVDALEGGYLARMAGVLGRRGVHADWEVLHGRSVHTTIASHAAASDAGLVVACRRPSGSWGHPLGAVAAGLVRRSPAPVLVAPAPRRLEDRRPARLALGRVVATLTSRLFWRRAGVAAAVALMVLVPLASSMELPYDAVAPLEARELTGLVHVEGGTTYEATGGILGTTVSTKGVTLMGAVRGWLDPDVDVVHRPQLPATIRGFPVSGRIPPIQLAEMTALAVAFRHLGYDVPAHGDGALVTEIDTSMPGSFAVSPGDVIRAIDGHPVRFAEDLTAIVAKATPARSVHIEVEPIGGAPRRHAEVWFGDDGHGRATLGLTVQTHRLRYDFPKEIDIDTGGVQGPSYGLAMTLAALEALTPEDLTHDQVVAATGTISLDGTVGTVAAVGQKALAARRAGADLFLVPTSVYRQAIAHAGDMRVVAVDSLDEALAVLKAS